MEKNFLAHLNTQTNSNLSWSFLKISQLVDWASENKLDYLAIADYYPYEVLDFFNLCKTKKIKPVWGVKIFLQEAEKNTIEIRPTEAEERRYSATIYPQNNKGYKEVLQKLFSPIAPNDRTFSFNYILSHLSKNCLIVLEAQKPEEIKFFANQWIFTSSPKKEVNYDNVFIGFNFFILSPSQNIPQKIVPLLLPFFSVKSFTNEENRLLGLWRKTNFSRHFLASDLQGNCFSYLDTNELFPTCTDDKTFYQLLLIQWQKFLAKISLNPSFNKEKKKKNNDSLLTLKSKCWQKLLTLKKDKENYSQVLEKELAIIEKFDYVDYFLVFSDAVKHLHGKNIIVGPGRGSAVSSLVAYLLEITSIDPLEHNLFFERFLNEKRKTLPDIDLDVENQEEIFKYLTEKYPKNQVARIATRKKIGWKNACQEAAKVCNIREEELGKILTISNKVSNPNDLRLQRWKILHPAFFALTEKIQNLYYDVSVHPAGIIINEKPLIGTVPLSSQKDFLLTFFGEDKLTQLGLKKYDFLSLKETFSFVTDIKTLGFLSEVKGTLKVNLPNYQEVDLKDKKTWELLENFLLTGIFQLDTVTAQRLFIAFRPQSFSELVLFLALNRPGTRKRAEEIIRHKNSSAKIPFLSPILKKILSETRGFIIFEEQISQILALVYECSFAEAEVKRRELATKPLENNFLTLSQKKISPSESKLIYQQITSATGYSFNKAHAVAYGYLTYYIAYLKANFFSELITHFLNNKKEKTLAYLREAFFYGFQIEKPDINYSQINWAKKGKTLIMGFSSLKRYRTDFFSSLIEERKKNGPYHNWENFLLRTNELWKKIEVSDFAEWVKSGLFSSLKVDVETLLEQGTAIFRYLQIRSKISNNNNNALPFLDLSTQLSRTEKKIANQREWENLGCYISYFSRWKQLSSPHQLTTLLTTLQKYNNQSAIANFYAVVCQIEKKDETNWTLVLQDVRNSFKLEISDLDRQENQEILTIHNELLFVCQIKITDGRTDYIKIMKISEL